MPSRRITAYYPQDIAYADTLGGRLHAACTQQHGGNESYGWVTLAMQARISVQHYQDLCHNAWPGVTLSVVTRLATTLGLPLAALLDADGVLRLGDDIRPENVDWRKKEEASERRIDREDHPERYADEEEDEGEC